MGSVEDTPETVGMLGKKLPVFRKILIEVGCNTDSRCMNGSQHAVCLLMNAMIKGKQMVSLDYEAYRNGGDAEK